MKTKPRGQALLFVVIVLTIILSVGMAITNRTISSVKRTTSTDNSSRVIASAEGGIEWFLRQPTGVLKILSDSNGSNNGAECPSGTAGNDAYPRACVLTFNPQPGDTVVTQAVIEISKFAMNSPSNDHYWFMLDSGDVKEVKLVDLDGSTYYNGALTLCWQSSDSSNSGGLYYSVYDNQGTKVKKIIRSKNQTGVFEAEGYVTADITKTGYDNCYEIDPPDNMIGLRIKSLYVPAKVAVFPNENGFSTQGFKISSRGQLTEGNEIVASKELTVYKSLLYFPAVFDYAIYSGEPVD